MAGYGRMDIMRMSDEEILDKLKNEQEDLPDYVAVMMIEELKKRKEDRENGVPEESFEVIAPENSEDFEDSEESEEYEDADGLEDSEKPEETPEERFERELAQAEAAQKESKRTLIIASAAAGIVALAVIVFAIVMKIKGEF